MSAAPPATPPDATTPSPPAPVAIVTGGSRGLGRALVTALRDRGWSVVTDGRDATTLAATAGALDETTAHRSGRLVALVGDVNDPAHRHRLVAAAGELGGPHLLVLNAGTLGPSPLPRLADLAPEALLDVLATNTVAQHALVSEALPRLRANKATVVAITSDAAAEAYEGWGAYGASKAALEHLARVLAEEEPDLTVHRVDPGDLRTDMHQAAFPGEDISDRAEPEVAVPGILALIARSASAGSGGRWRAQDLAPEPATASVGVDR